MEEIKKENHGFLPWVTLAAILVLTMIQLRVQGRVWWCACGQWNLWAGDIWSAHNSQHFLDPYSFTHVLHGMAFCGLIFLLRPRMPFAWKLVTACALEAGWEILENSAFIIERYREATISLGYEGDSIINSVADVLCCGAGFLMARKLSLKWSLVVFFVAELVLLFWVRDNLTLNVLMLIYPVESIRTWQMLH